MMTRTQLAITVLMIALTFGTLGYFSTMQLEHGKRHAHWEETR